MAKRAKTTEINTGHVPMVSKPTEVLSVVRGGLEERRIFLSLKT